MYWIGDIHISRFTLVDLPKLKGKLSINKPNSHNIKDCPRIKIRDLAPPPSNPKSSTFNFCAVYCDLTSSLIILSSIISSLFLLFIILPIYLFACVIFEHRSFKLILHYINVKFIYIYIYIYFK